MNQYKNQLTTTTGNGVALRNASKSLKITNKLLAEVDDFGKQWQWWLSLDDKWRILFLSKGLAVELDQSNWFNKILMREYIEQIFKLQRLNLSNTLLIDISALENLTNLIQLDLSDNQINDISALAKLTKLNGLYLFNNQIYSTFVSQEEGGCSIKSIENKQNCK